ncbi:hypothetical protein JCM10212_001250 [Sporobolomyces blumeae]
MSHLSSSGCPLSEVLPRDPVPFLSAGGDLNFKAHDVGWLMAGILSLITTIVSVWLISKHLSFFHHPAEQRLIVRILFMPIIYAWCSFFSYYFVHQALYWQLARDAYEAVIIASFFHLLLSYLSNPRPSPSDPFPRPYKTRAQRAARLRATVRDVHVKKWVRPLGFVNWRPARGGPGEGEAFLWWMRVLVGQYVVVRPLTTLASVVSNALGWYCLASWSPKFVHVWSSAIITVSVTVAMYCVFQLYVVLKKELEPYSPVMKFLAVKLVVFFTFWQESALGLLVTIGVIKDRTYWSSEDIVVGIAGLLSCFEMVCFSLMHIKAFSYLPYRALASPVDPDARSSSLFVDDELDEIDPLKPLTFQQWSAWDERKKAVDKERSRLAKPKMPKLSADGRPVTKPDGRPILQQTRKWPAFVKCIRMSDLARELGEETKWVVRGGKVEMEKELLEACRKDDLEAVVGTARPAADSQEDAAVDEGFDEELRRIREGGAIDSRATVIDENGRRVDERRRGRRAGGEDARLLDETGTDRPSQARTVAPERPSPTRPSLTPLSSDPPDSIPLMASNSTIPLPAPHHLDSPLGMRARQAPPIPIIVSHAQETSHEMTTSSQDSGGHLPSTSLRPTSYTPRAPIPNPSPPPFSRLARQASVDPPALLDDQSPAPFDPPTFETDIPRFPPALPSSTVTLPPAAFFAAGPLSTRSRGLPPGARPREHQA